MASMAAPAAGPVLGGWLLTVASWRWMFFLNVPVGVAAVVLGVKFLRRNVGFLERRTFDWVGLALVSTAMVALLLAASEGATWGWRSPQVIGLFAGSAVLLTAFAVWVLRRKDPLLDVRMFAIGPFTLSITIIALRSVGQFGRLVFIPLELEGLRSMSPLQVGIILCPSALAAAAIMPVAGRLSDRIDPRLLVGSGLASTCAATWGLAHLTVHTGTWALIGIMTLAGIGTGLSIMPCVVVGLNSLPSRLIAQGTAIRQLLRQVVAAVGIAALSAVVISRIGSVTATTPGLRPAHVQAAYNDVFLIAFWMSVLGLALVFLLPGRERNARFREERAKEFEDGSRLSSVMAE